jgi:hypothetical protein
MIAGLPDAVLAKACRIGESAPVTLEFLIDHYVLHMRHHLDQVMRRGVVTTYPRP